ncbi:hypothetical protein [Streptomyces sp. NPDC005752]|uniref:hypothetical protein n=1 Tax=Streptomyces sp. NPDC005752 TaxID=3157065 RepID=UPI0033D2B027
MTASPFSATSAVQQRQASEHITRDWPTAERVECARLLLKYPDATVQRPTPGSEDGPVAAPRRAVTYVP